MGDGTNLEDGVLAPSRQRLTFDLDVDVCVVGAGLAGLTVARELARQGATVAVVEGRQVGWNASGHNLGMVMPGFGNSISDLIARVGFDDARDMWTLAQAGSDYVRAAVTDIGMPGMALTEGALEVSNVDTGDELIRRLQTLDDFGADVEGWQVDRVRDVLKTNRYFHAIHFPNAFQIDGRRYVHGLAALAEQAGARIFEDTPVVSVDPAGIRKRISTPSALLRASHIVLAGGVHLGGPLQRLSDTLLPVWRYAAVTAPLGDKLAQAIAFRRSDQRHRRHCAISHCRWRPSDVVGNRIHVSCRQTAPFRARDRAADLQDLSAARAARNLGNVQWCVRPHSPRHAADR